MTYEIYFEGECGMESLEIEADNAGQMLAKLRKQCPNDIGADGFYIDPVTDDERPLKW